MNIAADAADSSPLWLKIILGAIPLAVAAVAAAAAIAATLKQRVERLSLLVQISKEFPQPLNSTNNLQRVIARELADLEFRTRPIYKTMRGVFAVYLLVVIAGYIYAALLYFRVIERSDLGTRITNIAVLVVSILLGLFWVAFSTAYLDFARHRRQMDRRVRNGELDLASGCTCAGADGVTVAAGDGGEPEPGEVTDQPEQSESAPSEESAADQRHGAK